MDSYNKMENGLAIQLQSHRSVYNICLFLYTIIKYIITTYSYSNINIKLIFFRFTLIFNIFQNKINLYKFTYTFKNIIYCKVKKNNK